MSTIPPDYAAGARIDNDLGLAIAAELIAVYHGNEDLAVAAIRIAAAPAAWADVRPGGDGRER